MSAVLGAAYHHVQTIIAIDFVQSRLDLAKEFGATHCINLTGLSEQDALAAIRAPTGLGSAGPDYAVEASGNMKAWKMAWDAIRPCGHMTTCGSPGPGVTPPIQVHETICVGKIWSAVLMGCGPPRDVSRSRLGGAIHLGVTEPLSADHTSAHRAPQAGQVPG